MRRADPLDRAVDWAQRLNLRPAAGRQWNGPCPVCRGGRCFSQTIKGGQLLWHCHGSAACSQEQIFAALHAIAPDWITPRRPKRDDKISREELAGLLDLDDCALRLRVACLAWRLSPKQAAGKLGMSRRTYYRAVSAVPNLARSRRSS